MPLILFVSCNLPSTWHWQLEAKLIFMLDHIWVVMHGGPIPWDDDVDLVLHVVYKDAFLQRCSHCSSSTTLTALGIRIRCTEGRNAITFYVIDENSQSTSQQWPSPFVDLFLYQMNGLHVVEVSPNGKVLKQAFKAEVFFSDKAILLCRGNYLRALRKRTGYASLFSGATIDRIHSKSQCGGNR